MWMLEKKKQMVTSLRVNPDLWKEAKIEAIREEITLAEVVEQALEEWITNKAKQRGEK